MATPTNLPAAQTTGNVLTAAYMNDLRGAFRILQVKSMTVATQYQATGAFADTGLTLSITPQSSSSQIMVFANLALYMNNSGANANVLILRGATTIWSAPNLFTANSGAAGAIQNMNYLDSPATTSATTYKLQIKNDGANLLFVNINGNNTSSLTLMEISA
jgi:hypothetical protein